MHNPKPIKIAMVNKDIGTVEKLADLSNLSRPTITKILRGEDVLPAKLDAVLRVLDLTRADVYEAEEAPSAA